MNYQVLFSKKNQYKNKEKSKEFLKIFFISCILISGIGISYFVLFLNTDQEDTTFFIQAFEQVERGCLTREVPQYLSGNDEDNDGIDNQIDIMESARERTSADVTYIDAYYSENEGKPLESEGVCTDLFWRAMEGAGFDFQEILYSDMKLEVSDYPLHIWNTNQVDKNIDFRRVPNIEAYLKKYANNLTIEIEECNFESISEWQPGDIVIFKLDGKGPADHIAIISNKRNNRGIPFLIHNWGIGTVEDDNWFGEIVGHYRW
ncbi:DUF1287 domain-containing protein [Candidatus Dojkabacteria bacterium]|nr:DUF1287 domain-containing protein [Candidatus Dojkabacteria bacterium]